MEKLENIISNKNNEMSLNNGSRMLDEQPFTDAEIREAFNIFDVNGSDLVSAPEIKFVLD